MIQLSMDKLTALQIFNGVAGTAKAIGVSYQAVDGWPDPLPARIVDRITAAYARMHLKAQLPPSLQPSVNATPRGGNPEMQAGQGSL